MDINGKKLIKGYGVYVADKSIWMEEAHVDMVGAYMYESQALEKIQEYYDTFNYNPLRYNIEYNPKGKCLSITSIEHPTKEYTNLYIEEVGLIV